MTFISIYIFIISWTCTDKGSLNVKALGDSADKLSLLALLLRGNRSEDIPPIIPTCLVTWRNQDSIEPAGSCPEPAADWPSAEHRAWALRKFSAPCSKLPGEARACWTSGSSRLRGAETAVRIRRAFPLEYESTSKIHALVNIKRESRR